MKRSQPTLMAGLVFAASILVQRHAIGAPITGLIESTSPLGQYLALRMTIDDTTTRFELTGPDYSYFAYGFDTVTMQGYSLIVQGTDAARTVHEQNLVGINAPGAPQATQNIDLVNTTHDSANNLSTVVIERANDTGDPEDAVFSTSMTSLNVVWGYNSDASPQFPYGDLDYHGRNGRGFTTITFAPVPEPTSLAMLGAAAIFAVRWQRRAMLPM